MYFRLLYSTTFCARMAVFFMSCLQKKGVRYVQ
jgi:hypothetical protein